MLLESCKYSSLLAKVLSELLQLLQILLVHSGLGFLERHQHVLLRHRQEDQNKLWELSFFPPLVASLPSWLSAPGVYRSLHPPRSCGSRLGRLESRVLRGHPPQRLGCSMPFLWPVKTDMRGRILTIETFLYINSEWQDMNSQFWEEKLEIWEIIRLVRYKVAITIYFLFHGRKKNRIW